MPKIPNILSLLTISLESVPGLVEPQWNLHVARVHGIINESLYQDKKSTRVCKVHDIVCFGDQSANAEKS